MDNNTMLRELLKSVCQTKMILFELPFIVASRSNLTLLYLLCNKIRLTFKCRTAEKLPGEPKASNDQINTGVISKLIK